jgi:crotonobetainyl-CoA:carnitine CoA-transferase CaiB-like acyl-CoA transferase
VNDIEAVSKLEALESKLTKTRMPDGRVLNLQPLPVDGPAPPRELSFPPRYGEHTASILGEIGFPKAKIDEMIAAGVAVQSELN